MPVMIGSAVLFPVGLTILKFNHDELIPHCTFCERDDLAVRVILRVNLRWVPVISRAGTFVNPIISGYGWEMVFG
jgi:hypothetical protein